MNEWEWQLLEDKRPLERLKIGEADVKTGDRVRLRPRRGGDIFDLALAGQIALVESIEQDYEGKAHLSVVLEDDPGRDLGMLRQPGHRFFFAAEEVEALSPEEFQTIVVTARPRLLVAGIGNIFEGDDGFGVEVVKQLAQSELPSAVRVADFGIRGFDLVYALQDGYEATILIDAYPHGQTPGTVSFIEPDLRELEESERSAVEPHGMDPMKVLRMAKEMNGGLKRILLVGCEPANFGGDEGHMGLSEPVEAAVEEAVILVRSMIEKILSETKSLGT